MAGPIRKILVHIDGTEESVTAAQYAILLAKTVGAELLGIYVINTRALNDLVNARIFLREEQEEYQHDIESDADKYLNHVSALAARHEIIFVPVKTNGSVHQEIRRIVKEQNVDLLVLGELSQIRSRRDEFYNEAERAMRGVKCSVLIVKDEDRVYDLFETDLD